MKYLRTVWTLFYLVVCTSIVMTVITVVGLLDRKRDLWWHLTRGWSWCLVRSCGVTRLNVRGIEHLYRSPGVILMANHQSHFDPPALMAVSDVPLRFLTKHSLFYFPFFGWAMWAVGMIAINRNDRGKAFASIDKAARTIAAGKPVIIFPEGSRADREGELKPFKKGGFVLATRGGIPIVPVGIAGTQYVVRKGWKWVRSGPVTLVFGEPIQTTGYDTDDKDALMAIVHERIAALAAEARAINAGVEDLPESGSEPVTLAS